MADRNSPQGKVIVTGAAGFIGKAIALALTKQGYEVIACVRPQKQNEISFCRVIGADFFQTDSLKYVIEPCDVVIHAASIRNRWSTTPDQYRQVNVEGTRALLDACVGKVKKFIYISSVGVHGFPGVGEINEDFPLIVPKSRLDYHSSKVIAEGIVRKFNGQIETVIIRPTITYGMGDKDGMVTRMIQLIAAKQYIQIGRGSNTIHLTFIDDLVNGLIQAMSSPEAIGQTFILSGREPIEIRKLFELIRNMQNPTFRCLSIPEIPVRYLAQVVEGLYWAADKINCKPKNAPPITQEKVDILCRHRSYSHLKAAKFFGYAPRIIEENGLPSTIKWMKENYILSVS